jgi:hypothetical protein
MSILSPSLAAIAYGLYSASEALLQKIAFRPHEVSEDLRKEIMDDPDNAALVAALKDQSQEEEEEEIQVEAFEMPQYLKDEIARSIAAREAAFDTSPQSGQIRLITEVIGPEGPTGMDLGRPLAVCLSRPYPDMPEEIWHGWLMPAEVDYANYWDILIEESDGPCDPLAGMISLLTPVYIYLPSTDRVVGQLSPERMAAVHSASADMLCGVKPDQKAHPGRIIIRSTRCGHSVMTGTPLGGEEDPRWEFQRLYQGMLPALEEPVLLAMEKERLKNEDCCEFPW